MRLWTNVGSTWVYCPHPIAGYVQTHTACKILAIHRSSHFQDHWNPSYFGWLDSCTHPLTNSRCHPGICRTYISIHSPNSTCWHRCFTVSENGGVPLNHSPRKWRNSLDSKKNINKQYNLTRSLPSTLASILTFHLSFFPAGVRVQACPAASEARPGVATHRYHKLVEDKAEDKAE